MAAPLEAFAALSPREAARLQGCARPFESTSPPVGGRRASPRPSAPARLLVNGCGRSGTHAMTALLRRNGIRAVHEGRGGEATVGWPYAGRLQGSWYDLWPMSNQPSSSDAHDPIFKVHRHPLMAISSIAAGLTSSGKCRNPSERRWDARAWRCATAFVDLPVSPALIADQATCSIHITGRLKLALHYWVKWNLLGDRWATHSFAVENVTIAEVAHHWCSHCERAHTCSCPTAAMRLRGNFTSEKVKARRGHGRRRPGLTWQQLDAIDFNMSSVARRMAVSYGYELGPSAA
ncbi:MAG: hypothetical protein SGPRY_012264 [Prymnesium sp.]